MFFLRTTSAGKQTQREKTQDPSLVRNVKTACIRACPHAISFGNVNDKAAMYSNPQRGPSRSFYVLEQLHVLPNVSYGQGA